MRRPLIVADPPEVFGEVVLDMTSGSERSAKDGLVDGAVDALSKRGLFSPGEGETHARLCIDEAVVNAMEHGNRFIADKKVRVRVLVDEKRWGVLVEDEGEGFDESVIPPGTDPDLEHGRGILLMRRLMDGVRYYRGGSAVLLEKRRATSPQRHGDTEKGRAEG